MNEGWDGFERMSCLIDCLQGVFIYGNGFLWRGEITPLKVGTLRKYKD